MSFTEFKGKFNFGQFSFEETLHANILMLFDWGFLNKEGFLDINIPTSGAYGGNAHNLFSVKDERYSNGRVWQGGRGNWVWESGLSTSRQPIGISGIFVNDTFKVNDGSEYIIDYVNGRVIFHTGISVGSRVHLAHSYKYVNVIPADRVPFYREVNPRSFRLDEFPSGDYARLIETQIQLPAVAIEMGGCSYAPYQIGGDSYSFNDIICHVIAENESVVKHIANMISQQREKTFFMFDLNRAAYENRFPLTGNHELAPSALTYPDLVALSGDGGFRYDSSVQFGKFRIVDAREQPTYNVGQIVIRDVRLKTEAILLGV